MNVALILAVQWAGLLLSSQSTSNMLTPSITRLVSLMRRENCSKAVSFTTKFRPRANCRLIANRVIFQTGDACDLSSEMNNYDLVFAGNLIDRLYQPKLFLDSMTHRIRAGGWLVITSPYTWLDDYTPPNYWLGGYVDNAGTPVDTFTGLSKALHPHFKLGCRKDIPFVIRETGRKHQHTIAELTAWHRVE